MRNFAFMVLFGLFIVFVNSEVAGASSGYKAGLCDGCSEGARQQEAINVSGLNSGRVYIIDRQNLEIYPFQVMVLNEPGLFQVSAVEIDGVADEIAQIDEALAAYIFLGSLQSVNVTDLPLPNTPNDPGSALDIPGSFVGSTILQNAVTNYVSSSLQGGIISAATTVLNIVLSDFQPEITVIFPDGTSYRLVHTHTTIDPTSGKLTFHYEIVEGSGLDANGVPIPESADQFEDGYTSTSGSGPSWDALLGRVGFSPVGASWQYGSGAQCLACEWEETPDGGILSCQRC